MDGESEGECEVKISVQELVDYVMEKADKCYSDDFPISEIETWIREFFEKDDTNLLQVIVGRGNEGKNRS